MFRSQCVPSNTASTLSIPEDYLCPVTLRIIADPVITMDGHTYERSGIENWLRTHETSPATNEPLSNKNMIPNIQLKKIIHEFVIKNKNVFEDELLKAAKENKMDQVKHLLLFSMLDKNVKDQTGWSLLHFAAFHGNEDLTIFLIEQGVQLNATSANLIPSDTKQKIEDNLDDYFKILESLNAQFDSYTTKITTSERQIASVKMSISQKEKARILLQQFIVEARTFPEQFIAQLSQVRDKKIEYIQLQKNMMAIQKEIADSNAFNNYQVKQAVSSLGEEYRKFCNALYIRYNLSDNRDLQRKYGDSCHSSSTERYWSDVPGGAYNLSRCYREDYNKPVGCGGDCGNTHRQHVISALTVLTGKISGVDSNIFNSAPNLWALRKSLEEMVKRAANYLKEENEKESSRNVQVDILRKKIEQNVVFMNAIFMSLTTRLAVSDLMTLNGSKDAEIKIFHEMVESINENFLKQKSFLQQNECNRVLILSSEFVEKNREMTTVYLIKNKEGIVFHYHNGIEWCEVTKQNTELEGLLIDKTEWDNQSEITKLIYNCILPNKSYFSKNLENIERMIPEFSQELLHEILFLKHQFLHLNEVIESNRKNLVRLDKEIWGILKRKYAPAYHSTENTPAHLAAYQGHINILSILFNTDSVNTLVIRNGLGDTLLHIAAVNAQNKVIQLLASAKINFEIRNNKQQTAVEAAREVGNYDSAVLIEDVTSRQGARTQSIQIVQLEREIGLQRTRMHEEIKEGTERRHLELAPQYRSQLTARNPQLDASDLPVNTEREGIAPTLAENGCTESLELGEVGSGSVSLHLIQKSISDS